MFSWFPNMDETDEDGDTMEDYDMPAPSEIAKHDFSVILEAEDESAQQYQSFNEVPSSETMSETVSGVHPVTRLKFGPKCRVNVPGYLRPNITSENRSVRTTGFPSPRGGRVTSQTKLPWYPDDREAITGRTAEELAAGGGTDSPSKLAHQRRLRAVYGPTSMAEREPSPPPVSRDPRDHTSSRVQLPLISTRSRARLQAGPFTTAPRPRGPPRSPPPPAQLSYVDKWEHSLQHMERVYTADLDPDHLRDGGGADSYYRNDDMRAGSSRGASRGISRGSSQDHARTIAPAQLPTLTTRVPRAQARVPPARGSRIHREKQAGAWVRRSMDAGATGAGAGASTGGSAAEFAEFDRRLDGDILALERGCGLFEGLELGKTRG